MTDVLRQAETPSAVRGAVGGEFSTSILGADILMARLLARNLAQAASDH